jgi:L-threonylcarbamoyladenylate synthase
MVVTRVLRVDPHNPEPAAIEEAAKLIREGRLVAFPTETVYGLGADALNPEAVHSLFEAKGRPANDPVIVHIADPLWLTRVAAEVPEVAARLAERFWPGPLTLILPKAPLVPDVVTAGLPSVAVRVPAHPVALALLRAADTPIAAPSANRFGHTSPTTAEHVMADLGGKIDLILDGGPSWIGVESTVLDLSQPEPAILRPGGVPMEALEEVLGPLRVAGKVLEDGQAAPSPGMLARHYSPRANLILVVGPREAALEYIERRARELSIQGVKVGILATLEDAQALKTEAEVESLGTGQDPSAVAQRLYMALRALDGRAVQVIFARDLGTHGLLLAVHDRLTRAATQVVVLSEE